MIARLDRTRFHVHILHVGQAPPDDDPVAKALSSSSDDVVAVLPSHDLQAAASLVWKQALDVLVFPEVGMDTHTYLLACRRLARVQVRGEQQDRHTKRERGGSEMQELVIGRQREWRRCMSRWQVAGDCRP